MAMASIGDLEGSTVAFRISGMVMCGMVKKDIPLLVQEEGMPRA